jgi:hypothetical protein
MIHALQYEPQGHRQRFDPHEQQDRNIHLHLHLNFTFRARQGRSIHANVNHLTRIFATLLAATVMPLAAFIFAFSIHDGPPDPLLSLGNLPFILLFLGLALAWGFGYLPLLVSAWRASPRGRFRLLVPLLLLLSSSFLFLLALVFGAIPGPLMSLVLPLLIFLFLAQPLIMALLLMWISREARTLRRTAGAQRRFSFVMACGLVLALLGELLWYLSAMFSGGMLLVVVPPVILAALIVAIWTFLESRKNAQARPKDASLFDVDSPEEPRGYRG